MFVKNFLTLCVGNLLTNILQTASRVRGYTYEALDSRFDDHLYKNYYFKKLWYIERYDLHTIDSSIVEDQYFLIHGLSKIQLQKTNLF